MSILITAKTTSGLIGNYEVTKENPHAAVEFTPSSIDTGDRPDIESIVLSDTLQLEPDININFVKKCVPPNPFYVRWINDLGGFEYQMFSGNMKDSINIINSSDFFRQNFDTENTLRPREIIAMEAKKTITVGVESVDAVEFERLRGIILSPRIDAWDVELQKWVGITLDSNAKIEHDFISPLNPITFTFRKEMITQF